MVLVNIYSERKSIIQHSIISRKESFICWMKKKTNCSRSFSVRHHCPTQSHNELRNDIRTLIRFFSLVHGEKKFCNDTPLIGKLRFEFCKFLINDFRLVNGSSSISNGLNNELNDAASLYGTTKGSGTTANWINALATSGQSTLSRKSG